jgi:hypothetical protein
MDLRLGLLVAILGLTACHAEEVGNFLCPMSFSVKIPSSCLPYENDRSFPRFQSRGAGARQEPQISMLCDSAEKFINKRMDDSGKWITDWEFKSTCIQDKVDILEYCRKVR